MVDKRVAGRHARRRPVVEHETKIAFRINALGAFFGKGGLGVPAELTSRDIAVLALLDVADAICMTDGLYWVREFKSLVKPIAKSHIAALGALPTMQTPESHSKDAPQWFANMYEGKDVGPSDWVCLPRLVTVRNLVNARCKESSKVEGYSPSTVKRQRSMFSPDGQLCLFPNCAQTHDPSQRLALVP